MSGATVKGSRLFGLPDSPPDVALIIKKTNFMPTLTGRIGYAAGYWLFYAKAGVAWSKLQTDLIGVLAKTWQTCRNGFCTRDRTDRRTARMMRMIHSRLGTRVFEWRLLSARTDRLGYHSFCFSTISLG